MTHRSVFGMNSHLVWTQSVKTKLRIAWGYTQGKPWFWVAMAAILGVVAARAGLCPDGLIFYSAALRTRLGQWAYVDYSLPQGPVAGWILALFFLLPVRGGISLLVASGLLNALATWVVYRLARRASSDPFVSAAASLLTAVWFLPVFGTYYNDHLAYFLGMLGCFLWISHYPLWSGVVLGVCVHAKQPIGVFCTLALVVSELVFARSKISMRAWLRAGVAFLSVQVAFVVYLMVLPGALAMYWEGVVRAAGEYCAVATEKKPWRLFTFLIFPWHLDPRAMVAELGLGRLLFFPFALSVYGAYYGMCKWNESEVDRRVLAFCVFSTLLSAALLGRFHGQLFFSTGIVFAVVLSQWTRRKRIRWALVGLQALSGALLIWHSHPQIFDFNPKSVHYGDLEPLRIDWAETGVLTKAIGSEPLALFGPRTVFPSLCARRVPINPDIYYQVGLSLPKEGPRALQWQERWLEAVHSEPNTLVLVDVRWLLMRYYSRIMASLHRDFDILKSDNGMVLLQRKRQLSSVAKRRSQVGPP